MNQDKDRKKLRGIFPTESKKVDKEITNQNSPSVFSKAGQFYAIGSDDDFVRRFEIIQSTGKKFNFSYALLPICILDDSSTLYIKAYELLITITGRNLDPLLEHFGNELILWIKASPSGKDDNTATTFIKDIKVEGKAVEDNI